LGGGSGLD
jgi:hypothetical protein